MMYWPERGSDLKLADVISLLVVLAIVAAMIWLAVSFVTTLELK